MKKFGQNFKHYLVYEIFILILAIAITLVQYQYKVFNLKILAISSKFYFLYTYILFVNIITVYLLVSLLAFNKILLRVFSFLIILTTSIFIYYNTHYSVVITPEILYISEARADLASNFITSSLFVFVIVYGLIPALAVDIIVLRYLKKEYKYKFFNSAKFLFLLILIFVSIFIIPFFNKLKLEGTDRFANKVIKNVAFELIYPENVMHSINIVYLKNFFGQAWSQNSLLNIFSSDNIDNFTLAKINGYKDSSNPKNYTYKNQEAKELPKTIVFMWGESLSSSHFKASGYYRETTPNLDKQKNLVFFSKTKTCASITFKAQPCIAKRIKTQDVNDSLNGQHFYNNANIKSFIDMLNHKGYKSYYIHVFNSETSIQKTINEANHEYLLEGELNNENLNYATIINNSYIKKLKGVLKNPDKKKLIIVYLKGNHPAYNEDFPEDFAKFKPVLEKAVISPDIKTKKDFEALKNSYDNSILYAVDYQVNLTINLIKSSKQNAMLFYVGDHGQNLTNNNLPSHGMEYNIAPKDVLNPMMFVWFSNNWLKNSKYKDLKTAKSTSKKLYNYENIYYDVLNCAGLKSKFIKTNSVCR